MKMLRRLLLLIVLFTPWVTLAAPSLNLTPLNTGISSALLSSSPSMLVRVEGYQAATLYVVHAHGAATAVNMACTAGPTQAVQAPVAVATVASTGGGIAYSNASFSYPVTQNATLRMVVAPLNDQLLACTFTAGGTPTASDTISVYVRLGGSP